MNKSQVVMAVAAVIFTIVSIAILVVLCTNPGAKISLLTIISPEANAPDGTPIAMWVHSPLLMMFSFGIFGGILSWLTFDNDKSFFSKECLKHMITGILATFMVPLFLQMIGSALLEDILSTHKQLYVFLGMCSAAAFIAQRFATSISDQLIKDANIKATHAEEKAENAVVKADQASSKSDELQVEQLKLKGSVHMLKKEYSEALVFMNGYLKHHPKDSSALWRKAYCLKRVKQYDEALNVIEQAIEHSPQLDGILIYNKACYMCLVGKAVKDIIQVLEEAISINASGVKNALQDDLDEDLKSINKSEEFVEFLCKYGISEK